MILVFRATGRWIRHALRGDCAGVEARHLTGTEQLMRHKVALPAV
jgi:hypothetical protein